MAQNLDGLMRWFACRTVQTCEAVFVFHAWELYARREMLVRGVWLARSAGQLRLTLHTIRFAHDQVARTAAAVAERRAGVERENKIASTSLLRKVCMASCWRPSPRVVADCQSCVQRTAAHGGHVEGELRATSVHSTFCGEQGCVFWTVRRQLACPSLLR